MFLYKMNIVDNLLSKVKSREQVKNDPDLCKLLENPFLKDDTELAIKYQEYKKGFPDADRSFVEYFFMHGPELDTGSLMEWRDIISKDPDLYEIGKNLDIGSLWEQKQNNTKEHFSWTVLSGLYDCLSKPCSYLSPTSEMVGQLGDSNKKYNLQNDTDIISTNLPSYMKNRIPRAITNGMSQLINMIGKETRDIFNGDFNAKSDPFAVSDAELIGGDLLSDIASKLGDCFRIYEHNVQYSPYNYDQNKTVAPLTGVVRLDQYGNTHIQSPRGNPVYIDSKLSDNSRLYHNMNNDSLNEHDLLTINNTYNTTSFYTTIYGGAVTATGEYYGDHGVTSGADKDLDTPKGLTANGNKFVVPAAPGQNNENLKQFTETKHSGLGPYVASHGYLAAKYFKSLLKKINYSNYSNLDDTIKKLADIGIKQTGKNPGLMVRLYFPNGTIDFQVADVNLKKYNTCWADISAQFAFTQAGSQVISAIANGKVVNTPDKCFIGNYSDLSGYPSLSAINNARNVGSIRGLEIKNNNGSTNVLGLYYFSRDFVKANEVIAYAKANNIPEEVFFEPWTLRQSDTIEPKTETDAEKLNKLLVDEREMLNNYSEQIVNACSLAGDPATGKELEDKTKQANVEIDKAIESENIELKMHVSKTVIPMIKTYNEILYS